MRIPVNLVFEDDLSEFVLKKLLNYFPNKYNPEVSYKGKGFGNIKANINGYNQACISIPFIVLVDLDNYECPLALINSWFNGTPHKNMIFRVAVREIESWLLADKQGFSNYLGISSIHIPDNPENENDPKRSLISIVKKSRKRIIREDIVPINVNAKIGPNYNGRLMEFVSHHWDLDRAKRRSKSLNRSINKLELFQYQI